MSETETPAGPPGRVVKDEAILDLSHFTDPDQLSAISRIEDVAVVVVPESLAAAYATIPTACRAVGGAWPVSRDVLEPAIRRRHRASQAHRGGGQFLATDVFGDILTSDRARDPGSDGPDGSGS